MAVPFRSAEQADVAIQVIQQLLGGFVEGRPNADAAEASNGVPNGLMAGQSVQTRWLDTRLLIQRQNVMLNRVQRLDVQPHGILNKHILVRIPNEVAGNGISHLHEMQDNCSSPDPNHQCIPMPDMLSTNA